MVLKSRKMFSALRYYSVFKCNRGCADVQCMVMVLFKGSIIRAPVTLMSK